VRLHIVAILHLIPISLLRYFVPTLLSLPFHPPSLPFLVLGMTLNCFHIFIVTGSFCSDVSWSWPVSVSSFIHSCIYLRILIISCLAMFLGTNSLSELMCHKAVNQSINQPFHFYPSVAQWSNKTHPANTLVENPQEDNPYGFVRFWLGLGFQSVVWMIIYN